MEKLVFKFVTAVVNCPQKVHLVLDRAKQKVLTRRHRAKKQTALRTVYLDDGLRVPQYRPNEEQTLGTNTNCSFDGVYIHGDVTDRRHFPLTPKVIVDGKLLESDQEIQEYDIVMSSSSFICRSEVSVDLMDVYPEFKLDIMKINRHCSKHRRPNKITRVFKRFRSSNVTPSKTSSSLKIDDVTTLHVMLGDERHDAGTCKSLRGVRLRYPMY